MRARLILTTVAALAVLGFGAALAGAATPDSAYRAQVNAICRSFAPSFASLKAKVKAAGKRNDLTTKALQLGVLYRAIYSENQEIEGTPVPPGLKAKMAPVFDYLRAFDHALRQASVDVGKGDAKGGASQTSYAGGLLPGLRQWYVVVGLRDCAP